MVSAEQFSEYVGREEQYDDVVTAATLARYAAMLDASLDEIAPGGVLPPLGHWLFLIRWVRPAEIGPDGHPRRGGFLPPIPLPRRMKAGGEITYHGELRIGDTIRRRSIIEAVTHKSGKSGPLWFVNVRIEISGPRGLALVERSDVVYREAGTTPPPAADETAVFDADMVTRRIVPDPVLLFRCSALTSNCHRIHYDYPYVSGEEGYPGLVVHGPLQAMLLADHARRMGATSPPARFSYRAMRPLFTPAPFWCAGRRQSDGTFDLSTRDVAGNVALAAQLTLA